MQFLCALIRTVYRKVINDKNITIQVSLVKLQPISAFDLNFYRSRIDEIKFSVIITVSGNGICLFPPCKPIKIMLFR